MTTIPGVVKAAAEKFDQAIAIEELDRLITYAQLEDCMVRSAAAYLQIGLKKGERVAIWAPNSADWIIAAIGAQAAGGVIVPLNTRMKGDEAAYILAKSGARILITVADFLETDYPLLLKEPILSGELPDLHRVVCLSGESSLQNVLSWASFLHAENNSLPDVKGCYENLSDDDISDIIFTSGTTGKPKGVMTTHRQSVELFGIWCDHMGLQPTDRYLVVNPFFHTFGYKAGWLACFLRGATVLPHKVFSVPEILERISRERVTVLPGPPTLYQSILSDPMTKLYDISSLRLAATGAAMIPVNLIEQMKQDLGFDTVVTAYGLTEACGLVTMCHPDDDATTIATTSGTAVKGVSVKVVDQAGNSLPPGEAGEILVKSSMVMVGYFEDAAATESVMTDEGWLHTGDIGVLDHQGYLKITDRLKDMLIVGGFNCYPAEIENIILTHPKVNQVAVVGKPDDRMGEVPVAFIVAKKGAFLGDQEMMQWCRDKMANYKCPRQINFVGELPLNASGKVQKFKLKRIM